MIHYYLYEPHTGCVHDNDLEFSRRANSIVWTDDMKRVLLEFEGVKLDHTFPKYVISKFGGDSIWLDDISSGCKTILNMLSDPSMVYSLNECGGNAVDYIYGLNQDVNVYASNIIFYNNLTVQIICHLPGKILPAMNIIDAMNAIDKEGFYECTDD